MIQITDKHDCCGCEACAQRCPRQCIAMRVDHEGFLYPEVDVSHCINCGLCEKVCPQLNVKKEDTSLQIVAAKAKDSEVQMHSSSGGLFSLLAEQTLQENGVVFGARFDNVWQVVHDCTETIEGLAPFRKSKYVQSRIGDAFRKAESYLKAGRKVLFTGTPCQINGLRLFLRKDYENLLAVDIACHGVPSPKVWSRFLKEYVSDELLQHVAGVDFRDKTDGWEDYRFTVTIEDDGKQTKLSEKAGQNIFMRAFLSHLIMRPSCEYCRAKEGHLSDLTIGDFWGIAQSLPQFYDKRGVSVVVVRSLKGAKALENLKIDQIPAVMENVIPYNGGFGGAAHPHRNRARFFRRMDCVNDIRSNVLKMLRSPFQLRLVAWIKRLVKKIIR